MSNTPDPVTLAYDALILALKEAALADGADYDRVVGFRTRAQDQAKRWAAAQPASGPREKRAGVAEAQS